MYDMHYRYASQSLIFGLRVHNSGFWTLEFPYSFFGSWRFFVSVRLTLSLSIGLLYRILLLFHSSPKIFTKCVGEFIPSEPHTRIWLKECLRMWNQFEELNLQTEENEENQTRKKRRKKSANTIQASEIERQREREEKKNAKNVLCKHWIRDLLMFVTFLLCCMRIVNAFYVLYQFNNTNDNNHSHM